MGKRKLPVKAILNRTILRDDDGHVLDGSRPYQFELRVGRTVLIGVWLNNTDEKSEEYFRMFVEALTGREDIETEIKG